MQTAPCQSQQIQYDFLRRVTFALTGHVDNHESGKSSAAFLGFHTFFRSSDSNATDVCFVVPLMTDSFTSNHL